MYVRTIITYKEPIDYAVTPMMIPRKFSIGNEVKDAFLNPRQVIDYRSEREDCLDRLLAFGNTPDNAEGYALRTVTRAHDGWISSIGERGNKNVATQPTSPTGTPTAGCENSRKRTTEVPPTQTELSGIDTDDAKKSFWSSGDPNENSTVPSPIATRRVHVSTSPERNDRRSGTRHWNTTPSLL